MKTLVPNQLKEAKEALKTIDGMTDKVLAVLPKKINHKDRKFYHLALVSRTNNPATMKYTNSIMVQQYGKLGYLKIKEKFTERGFYTAVLLHNPENLNEDETPRITQHEETQIRAKVEKELSDKHEKEKEEMRKEFEEKLRAQKAEDKKAEELKNQIENFDVAKANKDALIAFAKGQEIELGEAKNVDDIRAVVTKWVEENTTDASNQ